MCKEIIEDLVAGSDRSGAGQPSKISVVRKLFRKGKRADLNLLPYRMEALARTTQIGFRWRAANCRTISNALKHEIELNSTVRCSGDAARKPFGAHDPRSLRLPGRRRFNSSVKPARKDYDAVASPMTDRAFHSPRSFNVLDQIACYVMTTGVEIGVMGTRSIRRA
jgi:hypothetical protein